MKILNWYVTRGFLLTFGMAILILTFAMTGANLVRVLDLVAQGISFTTFLKFVGYMLPIILTFTVPWAVMVAVMLVFGRMSADSEITAMRACGISILQIVSPILLITVALTAVCLYLQVEVGPPLLGKSRSFMKEAAINQPLALFEPGKQIQMGDTVIYIEDKEGENAIKGVQIIRLEGNPKRDSVGVYADQGTLEIDRKKQVLNVSLKNCLITNHKEQPIAGSGEGSGSIWLQAFAGGAEFAFPYAKEANEADVSVRAKYMKLSDLMGLISMYKKQHWETTKLEVELNQRIAFALSPIAFLLLGMPLAIRTNRRETSIGLFLSVILAGVFFLSIILCESLSSFPKLYPQYLLWLPNIIFQLLGAVMTYRISQR